MLDVYKPADQQEEYQQSVASTSSSSAQMNESSALEDLNLIEMNQLLANTSINTADYLDQTLNSNMDFCVDQPSTSSVSAQSEYSYSAQQPHTSKSDPTQLPGCSTSASTQHQHYPHVAQNKTSSHFYYHSSHSNHHMSSQMMNHHPGNSVSHRGQLLQPAHMNNEHHHFQQPTVRSSTSYGYNHQQVMYHRRVALMNGVHPPGSNQLSTSPDSGIQSIDGSPPSSMCTPPMVSPYTVQVVSELNRY